MKLFLNISLLILLSGCTILQNANDELAESQHRLIGSKFTSFSIKYLKTDDSVTYNMFNKMKVKIWCVEKNIDSYTIAVKQESEHLKRTANLTLGFGDFDQYHYLYITDQTGEVKELYFINEKTGKKKKNKIHNLSNSLNQFDNEAILIDKDYNYPINNTSINCILVYRKYDSNYAVAFLSKEIPFKIVKVMTLEKIEFDHFLKLDKDKQITYKGKYIIEVINYEKN